MKNACNSTLNPNTILSTKKQSCLRAAAAGYPIRFSFLPGLPSLSASPAGYVALGARQRAAGRGLLGPAAQRSSGSEWSQCYSAKQVQCSTTQRSRCSSLVEAIRYRLPKCSRTIGFGDPASGMTPTPLNAGGVARCPRQPLPKYYKTAGNPTAAVSQSGF